jgi:hypothetical protein
MPKRLHVLTIEYLTKAVEDKEAEMSMASSPYRRERLSAQYEHLKNRLETELRYLAQLPDKSDH